MHFAALFEVNCDSFRTRFVATQLETSKITNSSSAGAPKFPQVECSAANDRNAA